MFLTLYAVRTAYTSKNFQPATRKAVLQYLAHETDSDAPGARARLQEIGDKVPFDYVTMPEEELGSNVTAGPYYIVGDPCEECGEQKPSNDRLCSSCRTQADRLHGTAAYGPSARSFDQTYPRHA